MVVSSLRDAAPAALEVEARLELSITSSLFLSNGSLAPWLGLGVALALALGLVPNPNPHPHPNPNQVASRRAVAARAATRACSSSRARGTPG